MRVGGGERVAGALDAGSAGGGAVPGHLLEAAFADQREGRLGDAFEVERHVGAPGVGGVVAQGDPAGVGALAEASREGALALQVLQAVEGAVGQEPQHLGDRLFLEHDGVPAGRNVPRRFQRCLCQGAQRGGFGVHLGPVAVAAGSEAARRADRAWVWLEGPARAVGSGESLEGGCPPRSNPFALGDHGDPGVGEGLVGVQAVAVDHR